MEKLIKFILYTPVDASFVDIKRILEAFNFEEVRSSGSHHIFRHPDGRCRLSRKKGVKRLNRFISSKLLNCSV
ncbi:type II toxin-antitoxin system HicA family toxin [Gloeothece citriformis]|uniref:type II toxin-antitoxin system HicA family toxin n=1 Tax=Gloeothece citriformis TaxID=2546356 RepID=UPI001EEFD1A6|nr:type II toxin-antitoxin system HicA family toxin [Gloeothece citriformis]